MEFTRAIVFGVFGAIVGSFLNVLIYRLPRRESIVRPGSRCTVCGDLLRARDNVPIISYLVLRARCRSCGAHISARYPSVEALASGLAVVSAIRLESLELAAFASLAAFVLIALSFIDLEHRRLPNVIVIPAAAVAVVWLALVALVQRDPRGFVEPVACGAAAFSILFLIAFITGGMGMGDVKLALFTGMATGRFGAEVAMVGLLLGFFVGGIVGIVLLLTRRKGRKDSIPFGPSMAAGAVIAMFFGEMLVSVWLGA